MRKEGLTRVSRLKIDGIIWYDEIIEKLERKHHVRQHEVREVFVGRPLFRFVEHGHRLNENVYSASGRTMAGRYLIVFFVHKQNNHALVLSARNMTDGEKKKFREKR